MNENVKTSDVRVRLNICLSRCQIVQLLWGHMRVSSEFRAGQ
jgi:hypothetical protein